MDGLYTFLLKKTLLKTVSNLCLCVYICIYTYTYTYIYLFIVTCIIYVPINICVGYVHTNIYIFIGTYIPILMDTYTWASQVALVVKNPLLLQET